MLSSQAMKIVGGVDGLALVYRCGADLLESAENGGIVRSTSMRSAVSDPGYNIL